MFSRIVLIAFSLNLAGCMEQPLPTEEIDSGLLGGYYEFNKDSEYILNFDSLSTNNQIILNGGTVHINLRGFNNQVIVKSGTEIPECNISGSDNTLDLTSGVSATCNDSGIGTTILH
jgi:hypothetical protein